MKDEECEPEELDEDSNSAIKIIGALVLSGGFESFVALQKQAQALGLRIIFAKSAPAWAKLWICEGQTPPAEAAGKRSRS